MCFGKRGRESGREKYSDMSEMEDQMMQNNISGVCRDLKTISVYEKPNCQPLGNQK